ncbi:hypothetical protein ACMZ6Z_03875 [Streptococcus pluranimalium]|uniref:hypothetical protein n=1 Tax=Streptococcus pluranimalium TaxID=82348 RepID=UPI0039FC5DAB
MPGHYKNHMDFKTVKLSVPKPRLFLGLFEFSKITFNDFLLGFQIVKSLVSLFYILRIDSFNPLQNISKLLILIKQEGNSIPNNT